MIKGNKKLSLRFQAPELFPTLTLLPDEGMGPVQTYDALEETYSPDRSLIPLLVGMEVTISGEGVSGINAPSQETLLAAVSGVQWLSVGPDGSETPLTFGTDYRLPDSSSGLSAARRATSILVCCNSQPEAPTVLLCKALLQWDGQVYSLRAQLRLEARSDSAPRPRLELSHYYYEYDPLIDTLATLPVKAQLKQGGKLASGTFYWDLWNASQGVWIKLDPNEISGAEFNLNAAGDQLSVTLPMIQDGTKVRCRAGWTLDDGTPAGSVNDDPTDPLNAGSPSQELLFGRRHLPLSIEITGLTGAYSSRTPRPVAKAVITDGKTLINNPADHLVINWYLNNGTARTLLGTGESCMVKVSDLPASGAAAIEVVTSLRPPFAVLTDSTGAVLTDSTGAWLIGR